MTDEEEIKRWEEHDARYNFYFDRKGQPLDRMTASRALRDFSSRVVGRTVIPSAPHDVIVSTVWLVMDHGGLPDGPPIIFETMINSGSGWEDQRRYTTEEEALAGHLAAVQEYTEHARKRTEAP